MIFQKCLNSKLLSAFFNKFRDSKKIWVIRSNQIKLRLIGKFSNFFSSDFIFDASPYWYGQVGRQTNRTKYWVRLTLWLKMVTTTQYEKEHQSIHLDLRMIRGHMTRVRKTWYPSICLPLDKWSWAGGLAFRQNSAKCLSVIDN